VSYPNILFGPEGLQYKQSTSARHALGQMLALEDGRRFRYVLNGTSATTPGLLFQSATPISSLVSSLTIGAMTAGSKEMTFTTTFVTNLITSNLFQEGYAVTMSSVAGGGQVFKIESNVAFTTGASITTNTITLAHGVPSAITSSVMVSLHRNPYAGVIVHPSPPTAQVVGWTMSCIASAAYGWLGTAGPLAGLVDMDPLVYQNVTPSTALNGAVNQAYLRLDAATTAAATTQTHNILGSTGGAGALLAMTSAASASGVKDIGMQQPTVGYCMSGGLTSGSYGAIFAQIDG